MPVTLTITGKTGPDRTLTAAVFQNGTGILILPDRRIVQFFTGGDTNSPPEKEIDISAATTITGTISGAAGTLTITIA